VYHVSDERDRKERVLHTRVPEKLEAELKERAAELGMSVSNLVRNVLTHAFDLVGDIVADGASVARSASGVRRSARPSAGAPSDPLADVIGWQPLVLQKNAVCARCNDILARGKDAAIAITDAAGPRPIVCPRCLEELRHEPGSNSP
jgi:plasmid stability protein